MNPHFTSHRISAAAREVVVGDVNAGETWQFTAAGVWHDGFVPAGPGGYANRLARLFGLTLDMDDAPLAALCGRIQDAGGRDIAGTRFEIGRGCTWQAGHSGRLVVFANDVASSSFRNNNTGHVTLRMRRLAAGDVMAAAPPRPLASGWWGDLLDVLQRTEGLLLISALVIGAVAMLGLTDLGRDIVLAATESIGALGDTARLWMTVAIAYLGFQAWFWPRRIIEANYGSHKRHWGRYRRLLTWWPRTLGVLPHIVALILIAISRPEGDRSAFFGLAVMEVLSGLIYVLFVVFRDGMIRNARGRWLLFLRWLTFVWPALGVAFSFLLFCFAWAAPAVTGQAVGPSAVVFFAVAGILPWVTIVAQLGAAFRIPAAAILLAWFLLCSLVNDSQHEVGQPPFAQTMALGPRGNMAAALADWQTAQLPENGKTPFFIIATEGGASRAGFWTAAVLDALEHDRPGFSDRVFAISSISGGSVGAVGWVKELQSACSGADTGLAGGDALSPAFASSFFPDALQRLSPFALFPDSALGLEKGWESNWTRACPAGPGLDQPYLDLWQGKSKSWRPLVLVGGASQETGRRVLTSPVTFAETGIDADDFFTDAGRDIPQSAAILNGARFPWISPPGRVTVREKGKKSNVYHVVDGGYFDNSGIETARQLMAWSLPNLHEPACDAKANDKDKCEAGDGCADKDKTYCPVLIVISYTDPADKKNKMVDAFANDALGPLVGLYESRDGHEQHMLDLVKATDAARSGWRICNIRLQGDATHKLPVDWVLSTKMRTYALGKVRDSKGFQAIARLLDAAAPSNGSLAAPDLACDA